MWYNPGVPKVARNGVVKIGPTHHAHLRSIAVSESVATAGDNGNSGLKSGASLADSCAAAHAACGAQPGGGGAAPAVASLGERACSASAARGRSSTSHSVSTKRRKAQSNHKYRP